MAIVRPLSPQDLYASSAFNPASLSIYHVGIHLDSEHLMYVVSTVQHEPLMVRLYKNRDGLDLVHFLEAVWQQDEFLRKRFAQGELIVDTDKWLVVPAEFVPDGQESAYLRAYYEIQSQEGAQAYSYRKEVLRGSGAAFLSLFPISLADYVATRLANFQVEHASYRYVQLSCHLAKQNFSQRPFLGLVWLFMSRFYYVLFQGDRLVFANQFSAAVAEDVLYYMQGLHSLLGVDKGQVTVAVGGYSALKPYAMTLLYRFFGAGYRDLGRVFPAPATLKEAGMAVEDILPLTFIGADTSG
ncbi:MAG: DUF3822 family protein [Bacteroidia bacterium]|nr:DUF3822 family protein [Bacteroidia bacterium]